MDYALPPAAAAATANRNMRAPQHSTSEISFEQWKGIANTWFMTIGKLALAGLALHFSGLAKPLLANFGYAPAQAASVEPAVRAPVPAAASLAAASIIPEGPSPESAEKPTSRRTQPAKREPSVASETTQAPARRHSYKSAHKTKPKPHANSARSAAATDAPAAAPQPVAAPQPAVPAAPVANAPQAAAAAPATEEAVGEALLRINSRPWSEIIVDGKHVGHTPKLDLRVSAGSHSIRLVNKDLGLTKTFEVDLAAGETASHVELFID
jgi:serine/threonine-protein kinase